MSFLVGCPLNLPWWRVQYMTTEEIERYNRGFLMEIDMPNPGAERPLRKITLNLFEEDCAEFERMHGAGWTVRIREVVHRAAIATKEIRSKPKQRTLGDLE